jgi:GNAT superfamily N-acetyltransferase
LTGGLHGLAEADVSTLVHPRLVPPAVLRSATAADVDALCAMHRRCSPESRYRRYLMATSEVSPANVRRLLIETSTIVAEAVDGQLVAMGNVALGDVEAEVALLVEDDWHRQGLGVCLAGLLAGQAVAAGARVLTATVIATNVGTRRALAAAGLAPAVVGFDAGTLELHCDLLRWSRLVPRPPRLASHGASPELIRDGADPDRPPVIVPTAAEAPDLRRALATRDSVAGGAIAPPMDRTGTPVEGKRGVR